MLVNLGKSGSLLIAAYGAGINLYTGFCAGRLLLYSYLNPIVRSLEGLAAIGAGKAVSVSVRLIVIGEAMSVCRGNYIFRAAASIAAVVGHAILGTGGIGGHDQVPAVRLFLLVKATGARKGVYVTDGGIFLGIAVTKSLNSLSLLPAAGFTCVILLTVLGTGRKNSVTDLFPIVRHIYGICAAGAHAGVYVFVTLHIILGEVVAKSGHRLEGCVILAARAGNVS